MENPASHLDARLAPFRSDPALQTRLDEAWRALQRELPTLVSLIDSSQVDKETAGDVVISATMRVLRNPEGAEEEASSIDDYNERTKRADSTQDLYFTSAELRRLAPPAYSAGSFSFTGYGCP